GVPAGLLPGGRAGRVLGARPARAGAGRLVCGRLAAVPEDVQLAGKGPGVTEPAPPAAGPAGPVSGGCPDDVPASATVAEDRRESFRSWLRIARLWTVAWHFSLAVCVVLIFVQHQPVWLLVPVAAMSASYLLFEYPWLVDKAGP